MKLILIGFMASGKTSVSQLLGEKLGQPVMDLDEEIERRSGQSIPELFARDGEDNFRLVEHLTLAAVKDFPGILATGGGTPLRKDNREILAQTGAPVVLLQASPETTYERLKNQRGGRPLADNLNVAGISAMQEQRREVYQQCADKVITTHDLSVEEIVEQILTLLRSK